MSEESKNNQEENIKENSDEIKSEAKNTFKDAKETMKTVNIKNDAKVTKGYVSSFLKDPLKSLNSIAKDSKNANFKNALLLVLILLIVVLLESIFGVHWAKNLAGTNSLNIIKNLLAPIIGLIALSCIIYFMQKNSKKNLTTILTTIITSIIPYILAKFLTILNLFSADFYRITSPILSFSLVFSNLLIYFSLKDLLGIEEDTKAVRKFVILQVVYFIIYFIFTFLGIYIPGI